MRITKEKARAIAEVLSSLACYNDKGAMWSGHTPAQVDEERQRSRAEIDAMLADMRLQDVPPLLREALESEALLTDWSGRYADLAEEWASSLPG